LIFVAFLLPLALYLLLLGWVNRQPRPLLVSGTIDFIGLLFAASGFLLLGGPAALSGFNEHWRLVWLLGETGGATEGGLDWLRKQGLFLATLYFFVIVAACVVVFRRRRGMTCVYNAEPAVVESALVEACERLGLEPIRSGNLFVFGLSREAPARRPGGLQAPHVLPRRGARVTPGVEEELAGHDAILDVEAFAAMKHVTLRWEPHDTPLRRPVEAELERRLASAGAPYHDTGAWLGLVGSALLVLAMAGLLALVLRRLLAG
jgi:hypothetical protein